MGQSCIQNGSNISLFFPCLSQPSSRNKRKESFSNLYQESRKSKEFKFRLFLLQQDSTNWPSLKNISESETDTLNKTNLAPFVSAGVSYQMANQMPVLFGLPNPLDVGIWQRDHFVPLAFLLFNLSSVFRKSRR